MLHNARHAYATLTLCALTLGFAPRPRVSRCTQLRLSPDREELRKLRVKELQADADIIYAANRGCREAFGATHLSLVLVTIPRRRLQRTQSSDRSNEGLFERFDCLHE